MQLLHSVPSSFITNFPQYTTWPDQQLLRNPRSGLIINLTFSISPDMNTTNKLHLVSKISNKLYQNIKQTQLENSSVHVNISFLK